MATGYQAFGPDHSMPRFPRPNQGGPKQRFFRYSTIACASVGFVLMIGAAMASSHAPVRLSSPLKVQNKLSTRTSILPKFARITTDRLRTTRENTKESLTSQRQQALCPSAKRGVSTIPKEYSTVDPTGEYILAKFEEDEDFSDGALWLPESLKSKPNLAEVMKLGTGRTESGGEVNFDVNPGDIVLYTRYGSEGTRELELEKTGENFALIRNSELAGKLPAFDDYQLEDFEPLQNFLLVRADQASDETLGGILLTDSDQDKPACGQVVKVGPGLMKDGARVPVSLKVGDNVMYNKYAGDELEDEDETTYIVLKEGDIICKLAA